MDSLSKRELRQVWSRFTDCYLLENVNLTSSLSIKLKDMKVYGTRPLKFSFLLLKCYCNHKLVIFHWIFLGWRQINAFFSSISLSQPRFRKPQHEQRKEQEPKRPHIKKPLNAFMLYMKEMRANVVAECTLKESAAINQILGRRVCTQGFVSAHVCC